MINTVEVESFNKRIKDESILNNINLKFTSGKIYGVHGRNGSGKTMLLRAIAGLIRPTSGRVIINGYVLHKDIDFPNSIGVLIETPDFWRSYTGVEVLQTLANIKKIISKEDILKTLERVGLIPDDKRTIRKYSLGMKQRLGIAQAIMESPEILLFDEPTNALDKTGILIMERIIKEEASRGAIVIIASHNSNELNNCDYLIKIENGHIIGG